MKKIIIGIVLCLAMTMMAGCNNIGNDEARQGITDFMSYGGAVFPLSLMDTYNGIIATRNIVFDFNGFGRSSDERLHMFHNDIRVSDRYLLTNATAEDKAITIVYPFAMSFGDLERLLPTMTINGSTVDATLWAGDRIDVQTWRDFANVLSDDSYFLQAITSVPDLSQQVIVYEFTNAHTENTRAVAPTLAASFNIDFDRTKILTYGFNGGVIDTDNNFMRQSFFVPRLVERSQYLIIIGDDIANFSLQGYGNGALNRGDEIDVTVDVRRFEAVLGDTWEILLRDFADDFATTDWHSPHHTMISNLFFNASAALLHDTQESEIIARRIFFGVGTLEDLFSHTLWASRIFYLTAKISIPAGATISVNVDMIRPGSYDFFKVRTGNEGLNGYDMFTTLGSTMAFDNVSVEIVGTEYIEIVRTNFGTAPNNRTYIASLDIDEPHFYIEVRRASLN